MDLMDGPKDKFYPIQSFIPVAKRRQQRDGSVMIWAESVDQTIIETFKVDEGVKLNRANNSNFIDKTFFEWSKTQSHSFKLKCVVMHNNALSHVSKLIRKFFEHKRFTGHTGMTIIKS